MADIKTDLRSVRDKLDGLGANVRPEIASVGDTLSKDIGSLREAITKDISSLRESMAKDFASVRESIADLRESIVAVKVWGLGLCLTLLAGVFGTMARAFGWI